MDPERRLHSPFALNVAVRRTVKSKGYGKLPVACPATLFVIWPTLRVNGGGTVQKAGDYSPSTPPLLSITCAYSFAVAFGVRCWVAKSTWYSPKRLEKPSDHSRLSISDHA